MDELKRITEGMTGEEVAKVIYDNDKTLLDKIPAEGNVAKVYQTTLSLNSIDRRDNKAATQAEVDEVLNVMAKYKDGYIVTVVEDNDYPYHYGVLNVGMMDDAMPITLIHYNDVGDVMAYMLEMPTEGALWVVTNKTSSKVYVSPFKFNEIVSGSFLTEDQKRIITDINVNYEKGNIVLMSETSITNFKFGVINFAHSATSGTTLSIVNVDGDLIAYHLDGTVVGASRWTVTNKTSGGGGSGESKVYVTTFDFTIIHGGAYLLTTEQLAEVEHIIAKSAEGYVVIWKHDAKPGEHNYFSAGTVNAYMNPVTFSVELTVVIGKKIITYATDGITPGESKWRTIKHTEKNKWIIEGVMLDNGNIIFEAQMSEYEEGLYAVVSPNISVTVDGIPYMIASPFTISLRLSLSFVQGVNALDGTSRSFMINVSADGGYFDIQLIRLGAGELLLSATPSILVQII